MVHLDDQYDILKVAPSEERISVGENLGMNWKGVRYTTVWWQRTFPIHACSGIVHLLHGFYCDLD
jgi:hypothetical protein